MHAHKEWIDEILHLVQSLDSDSIADAMKLKNVNEKLKSNVKNEKQMR